MKKIFVLIILGLFLIGCGGEYQETEWFQVTCYSENGTAVFDKILYRDNHGFYHMAKTGKVVYLDLDCTYIEIDDPR